VYLHHRGEPLLNPAIFDMIACAREAGLRTRFHSNGTLLDEARARRLLDAGPDLVSFSVDGFAKEAYERIRVGARFETTVENIVRLVERRRSLGRDRPYVIVERIRFRQGDPPELAEDVRTLTRRFLEAGVDEVIAKEEYTWAEEDAPELEGPLRQAVCTFPWYSMVICWDGTVTPCPQDFRAHIVMGNAAQTPLREIWNGPAYRDLRRCLATDLQSLALCHKCDRLRRKTVGGVPLQYMLTFLTDQLVGYSRLRRLIGSAERN
jgi:radical SAM protein with 4Fe4S-binding SPASM domain